MDQVRGLLEDKKKNIKNEHPAVLFSAKALDDVKARADQCLIIFWRIKDVIIRKRESRDFEEQLANRLDTLNKGIAGRIDQKLPRLDSLQVLSRLECLK